MTDYATKDADSLDPIKREQREREFSEEPRAETHNATDSHGCRVFIGERSAWSTWDSFRSEPGTGG